MRAVSRIEGIAAPLMRADVDTDAIFPARFYVLSEDFGSALFANWRFARDGTPRSDFVLNDPRYAGASILLAGRNFGCGSSRENAVWALMDAGFQAVIAPSFGEIFYGNAASIGLIAARLPESTIERLAASSIAGAPRLVVDLLQQVVITPQGACIAFDVDARVRDDLVKGIDPVSRTLVHSGDIETFIREDRAARPWIYPSGKSGQPGNRT